MLRQAIIDQRFPPGTRLVERELCELLGVSRTSVREALRHLESEQLIRTEPHKGPVVANLSMRDAEDLYHVRAALEGLAGELFTLRASERHIADLQRTAKQLVKLSPNTDPKRILEIVKRLYQILFDGAQNPVCANIVESLNSRISILRHKSLASPGRHQIMLEEVHKIVDAAKKRDPEQLKQALIDHVSGASQAALSQLKINAAEDSRKNTRP